MLAVGRIIAWLCAPLVVGGLFVSSPTLVERAGMVKRELTRRTDGVGIGIHSSPCALSGPASGPPPAPSCEPEVPAAPMLGSHVLLWHEDGSGPATAVTPAIDTQASGSSLLAFSAGYASNTSLPIDNKGNAWTPLGAPVVYRGYNGQFDVKAYVVASAHGGSGHQLSIAKNGVPFGEITIPFIEIRQSAGLHAIAQNYPASAPVVTSGSVTTSAAATLVAVWWGDATGLQHSAIPNNGFSIIENFVSLPPNSAVQCVVAVRQVGAAGTYNVSWSQSPSEGAILWLLAYQAGDALYSNGFE